jgi:amidase
MYRILLGFAPSYDADKINCLDYSTCVVPVTYADKDIDKKDNNYKPVSDKDKENWDNCISSHGV